MAGIDVSRWNLGLPLALLGGCTRIDDLGPLESGTHGDSSGSSTAASASMTVAEETTQPHPTTTPTSMEGSEDVDPSVGECDACQPGECCVMNECVPAPYDCPPDCPLELCCEQACPPPEDCFYDEDCEPGYACDSGMCAPIDAELECEPQLFFEQQLTMLDAVEVRALAFVDADGDPLRDLVIGSSDRVQLLRSTDGMPFDLAFGIAAESLAVGDLDADGDEDLVVGDGSPEGGVVVFLHEDGETFVQLPAMPLPGIVQVVLADVEGQGFPGVLALDDVGGVSWLRNTGMGELEPAYLFTESAASLAAGLLDADATTDVVVHQWGREAAYTGGPSSDFELLLELGNGAMSRLVTVGNYDGSSPDDVIALQSFGGTTIAVQWHSPATFGFAPYRSWWTSQTDTAVRADLDDDGFDDIVTTTSEHELRVVRGGSSDGVDDDLIACTMLITPMSLAATVVAVGDLTGDGLPDLAISDGTSVALLARIE